jgi:hypothetical protein
VIRDLIPYELGGCVDYERAADGVCCKLQIPARWLDRSARPVNASTVMLGSVADHQQA